MFDRRCLVLAMFRSDSVLTYLVTNKQKLRIRIFAALS